MQKAKNMGLIHALETRSENKCELCKSVESIEAFQVAPKIDDLPENQIVACTICREQINGSADLDPNHWRCLNESMWSEVSAVKVISYRMLDQLKSNGWAADLLGMIYLEEEELEWAQHSSGAAVIHKDSNGNILNDGDTVTLIQDLNVKGAGFTAKRGTAVRKIRLVRDNAEHIEGKVETQHIVILTKYVKKSN